MLKPHFTQEQLVQVARLSDADIAYLNACRGVQNKIGSAYQICYVKLFNCFPVQSSFEVLEELATFVAIQLGIPREQLARYARRQPTISAHQEQIRRYLELTSFTETAQAALREYLFAQALQIQESESLFLKATEYLWARKIVSPADYVIERLIKAQREKVRGFLYERMKKELTPKVCRALDDLLVVSAQAYSKLYQIKEVPKKPSENAMKLLSCKLDLIEQTGVLTMPMDWLNNNYKRYFRRYVTRCDANRLRELDPLHRYTSLVCFLQEAYQDTKDHIFDMYHKAVNRVRDQAERTVDRFDKAKRTSARSCLTNHRNLCRELLAVAMGTADIEALLQRYPSAHLQSEIEAVNAILSGKYSNDLTVMGERFSYLRHMAKPLLEKLTLELAPTGNASLLEALTITREILSGTKRSVPGNLSLEFLPKSLRQAVRDEGGINRKRFEAAVFTCALPENIKCANLAIIGSKRYTKLENFFIDFAQWEAMRQEFFRKNRVPQNPKDVPAYLEQRLEEAFTFFLGAEKANSFAKVGQDGWELSKDPADELSSGQRQKLEKLKTWLSEHMRVIKLPDLLIEVDNDLHFTDPFLPATRRQERNPDDVCNVLTTLMCYGCNIGPHLMPQIVLGISSHQIKHMFDWQLTEDTNRLALALVVNGIASIAVTKVWGEGKTAAGDGQRFGYRQRTVHRTFSHTFNDFAIELYIFVADNFALFHNLAKEATDKDTSKVLDAHLYNVSDLDPEEWYFDTGGYSEINFTAFAMLGKSFCPRIKNIQDQWIYRIREADYGSLNRLLKGANHTIKMEPIVDQWDRMGHFYASLEAGYVTASTALRRLTGHTEKNLFYRANVNFGRILKTEHILYWMADPLRRKRARKGLLKAEQVHQMARDITYGNRGRFKARNLEDINSSGNCTALIIAAITYWQAKEISRVIRENDPEAAGVDLSLLAHVSPIEWTNVILYGEYKLNRELVK